MTVLSDHLLWVDVKDKVDRNSVHRVYVFFGHPSMVSSLYVPEIDNLYMILPSGVRSYPNTSEGDWLPGYGYAKYLFSDFEFSEEGDYTFAVSRSPAVYDMGWHGEESNPFLSYNFAKAVIKVGDAGAGCWEGGLPLEIVPQSAPYNIKTGNSINFRVTYLGTPVKAEYSASYWTWDEHGDPRIIKGHTDNRGEFSIKLTQGGLWFIVATYIIPQSGCWTATHTLEPFFKIGDVLSYKYIRYKMTLSIWAK